MAEHVAITHPDRVLWPAEGHTKGDLAEALERLASRLLPHVAGRPVSLYRCPRGIDARGFWQRHLPKGFEHAFDAVDVDDATWLVMGGEDSLRTAAQLGAIELHPWNVRADDLAHPERLIIDLDPGPEVPVEALHTAARTVRERLADRGLASRPLSTGGRGLHVIVPLARRDPWRAVSAAAGELAAAMVAADTLYTTQVPRKRERRDRILVDWARNHPGATAISPWSPRARPGAPVARPLSWDDLGATLTLADVLEGRIPDDPWAEAQPPQTLAGT